MDFIDLPSIFQDISVTSFIPDYFQNSELPIICYKYKVVKILNLYTRQPVMLSLEI